MWYDFEAAFESKKSEAEEMLHDEDKLLEFISKVLKKLDTIPVVGSLLGDIPLLCMIVVDYVKGEYTEIPLASVIGIIAAQKNSFPVGRESCFFSSDQALTVERLSRPRPSRPSCWRACRSRGRHR